MGVNVRNEGAIFGVIFAGALSAILYVLLSLVLTETVTIFQHEMFRHEVPHKLFVIGAILQVIVIIGYIVGTVTIKSATGKEAPATAFFRGLLIGINSVMNAGLVWIFLGGWNHTAALIIGGVLGGITVLSCISYISNLEVYQGIVGYLNWVLPMSLPIVIVGLLFLILSAILCWIPHNYLRFKGGAFDGKTGTIFIIGGWIANLNYLDTAFNMGNFSFVDYKSSSMHIDHEAGHTLNLAVFGFVFHLVGALDENVFGGGHRAFAEFLAESNVPITGDPRLLMWA